MTTYTGITNAQVDVDSPVTQTLMTLLRDNPLAVFEGDSTAPRIAQKWANGASSTGAALSFTGLDTWPAYLVLISSYRSAASDVNFALSDDGGSTYDTASAIYNSNTAVFHSGMFHIDLSTGNYDGAVMGDNGSVSSFSGTAAGGSTSVDAFQFTWAAGGSAGSFAVTILGIGEDSTS